MTKREILGISVLLLVILVYVFDQFLYQPLKLNKTRLANEQRQIIQELEEIDALQIRNQKLLILEPQIKQDYQKMITQIPPEPMISDTVRYLEWSATQAEVAVASCVIQDLHDKPKLAGGNVHQGLKNGVLTPVRLQVIACGDRYHLLCFLLQIDNSPRLMIIEDLSWRVDEPKDGFIPPTPGPKGVGEVEKTGAALNDGETETITISLTIYSSTLKQNTSQ